MPRRQALIETALVFLVFFIQGAWPVPDVNEPNYLGKAIHFWDPGWVQDDFFLETADTHGVFYFTFGWLALWLPPVQLAWLVRLLTWALMAWAWRRLSLAVVPRPWLSVVTGTLLAMMVQRFNMAGEWFIGGAEAKGFAFVLVFLALEALVRGRWNRALVLVGGASAFHVLVGGWVAVAFGVAWLGLKWFDNASDKLRPPLRTLWPGLVGGLLLALPGLLPSLLINRGVDRETIGRANEIYVYERLPHHLDPWRFPAKEVLPFVALSAVWLVLCRLAPPTQAVRRLRAFVAASLVIAAAGLAVSVVGFDDRVLAAGLLKFYWFRLADVAVPMGVALMGAAWLTGRVGQGREKGGEVSISPMGPIGPMGPVVAPDRGGVPPGCSTLHGWRRWALAAAVLATVLHLADCLAMRLFSAPPHRDRVPDPAAWQAAFAWLVGPERAPLFPLHPRADRLPDWPAWREACDWVAQPGNIPENAVFFTPRMSQTFKWYARRGEVVTWKEIPQDAAGIVQWWRRVEDIYATRNEPPAERWYASPADAGAERLLELAEKYGADYAITAIGDSLLPLPVVYQNQSYVIYRLPRSKPRH